MNMAALKALMDGNMDNFLIASTPDGIEQQEAEGQKTLVESDTLPIECPQKELEGMGFVFGAPVDDLFIAVQFPQGWSKRATDHSLWSDLIDPDGNKRGSIFYKAAFYDRRASMTLAKDL